MPSYLFCLVFLLGLALGGYFWGRKADNSSNPLRSSAKLKLNSRGGIAAVTFLGLTPAPTGRTPIENFVETRKPNLPFVDANDQIFFSKRALLFSILELFLLILILVLPAQPVHGGDCLFWTGLLINNLLCPGRAWGISTKKTLSAR